MIRNNHNVSIQGYSPEEYASQWGCDASYDRLPNLPGDGCLFYNFSSENVPRTAEWLANFASAIERSIVGIRRTYRNPDLFSEAEEGAYLIAPDFMENERNLFEGKKNIEGLTKLLIHVRSIKPE